MGAVLCSKTSVPTVTVEQLQFVMNPVVGFLSRWLLNTKRQIKLSEADGCVWCLHLMRL